MDLAIEIIIMPRASTVATSSSNIHRPLPVEGFQHLLDLLLQRFNERWLIFNPDIASLPKVISLNGLPLPLSLNQVIEEGGVCIFGFELFRFQIDHLPQLIYIFWPLDDQSNYLLDRREQSLFGIFATAAIVIVSVVIVKIMMMMVIWLGRWLVVVVIEKRTWKATTHRRTHWHLLLIGCSSL